MGLHKMKTKIYLQFDDWLDGLFSNSFDFRMIS